MANFVGKITFNHFIGLQVADIDLDGQEKKCLMIPIQDNGIINYNGEWQYWFRAFKYREQKGRFSHFLMKFVPRSQIKKLSAAQLEAFAKHKIGGLIKSDTAICANTEDLDTDSFIQNNL